MKYFHQLSKKRFKLLTRIAPFEGSPCRITWGLLGSIWPQPSWCRYPGATEGQVGCWSLVSFYVTGEEYCSTCDLYSKYNFIHGAYNSSAVE